MTGLRRYTGLGHAASERGSCPCALRRGSTQASADGKTHLKNSVTSAGETWSSAAGGQVEQPSQGCPRPPLQACCPLPWLLEAGGTLGPPAGCSLVPRSHPLVPLQSRAGVCWELMGRSCLIVTPGLNVQSGSWLGRVQLLAPQHIQCPLPKAGKSLNDARMLTAW